MLTHRMAACSLGTGILSLQMLQMNGYNLIIWPGTYEYSEIGNANVGFTSIVSSSAISRRRASSDDSPVSIFPPGNSHTSGRVIDELRNAQSTPSGPSIMAQATLMISGAIDNNVEY